MCQHEDHASVVATITGRRCFECLVEVSRLNYALDGVPGNAFVKLLQRRV